MSDAGFVAHEACPACGSSDANSVYGDGHKFCFSCHAYTPADGEPKEEAKGFLKGDPQALLKRGIDEETCRKFGYMVARDRSGATVQAANYRDPATGQLVAQKVRGKDKSFTVIGDGKSMPLFGQHLWPATGRRVVITEGEIDALSVAQVTGLRWPVVSLPNGAQSAKKALQRALEWLNGYETVVLAFDMDEPGRKAAIDCAPLFKPGQCKIAELPRKDANEMLQAGEVKELSTALWDAREYRPDGIVTLGEIEARVLATPEVGRPYPWKGPTEATFGRRLGDVIGLGAGSGVGKTDWMTQTIANDVVNLGIPCGVVYLEQSVGETGRRIAGKLAGKRFHVPDGSWGQAELQATWSQLKATNRLFLYDSWGALDWDTVRSKIRYMVASLGAQHIFLDHLTALAATEDDERKALERIMAEAASDAQSLHFILHYVSHLATPEGKPHEENGRVMMRHFKGSRAIGYWSHTLWGLERDTQEPGTPTVMRNLKDRFTGSATGQTWGLQYDSHTGRLNECALPKKTDDVSQDF